MTHPRDGWQGQSHKKTTNTLGGGVRNHALMGFHNGGKVRGYADGDSIGLFEGNTSAPEPSAPQAAEVQSSMADNTQANEPPQNSPGQADQDAASAQVAGEQSSPGQADQDLANAGAKAGTAAAIADKIKEDRGYTPNIQRGITYLKNTDGPVGDGARAVSAMKESKAATAKLRAKMDTPGQSDQDAASATAASKGKTSLLDPVRAALREFGDRPLSGKEEQGVAAAAKIGSGPTIKPEEPPKKRGRGGVEISDPASIMSWGKASGPSRFKK